MGDKWKTSVNSCAPKDIQSGRHVWQTNVKSCGPRHPEWETSVRDKWGQVGDKCKLMRPKATRVRDKCGRQGGDQCKLMPPKEPRVGDKGETSVN